MKYKDFYMDWKDKVYYNWDSLKGCIINKVTFDRNVDVETVRDPQVITFFTNKGNKSFYTYGDCCSQSWIEHISGFDALIGQEVLEASNVDMGEISPPENRDNYSEVIQQYSYDLKTLKGYFKIELRNESNGYYGGNLEPCNFVAEKPLTEDF